MEGSSCQTSILYLIPYGESASTDNAFKEALSQLADIVFLTNIINDKIVFDKTPNELSRGLIVHRFLETKFIPKEKMTET